ncbi:alpha/beta fold hydrolase [Methylomonas sp. TEB]|uniref:alpha/beta fold hydrolase n=1 Tax=Methylomonas sp. TEB TaxID=3398229 RepID=UPI0039F554FE
MPVKRLHLLIKLSLLLFLAACSTPAMRLHEQATAFGFQTLESEAVGFKLTSFTHLPPSAGKRLHVYLEGDGSPWERGLFPASDPTTRTATVLSLMASDPKPALYLGRPCYNGHAGDPGCSQSLWTGARYSESVVAAMTQALTEFCTLNGYSEVMLIGHSGGGTLALLIAERLPQAVAVVTLAGNYDIDIWADHHRYQHLHDSLNPAKRVGKPGIAEWHLLGQRDHNIPPALFQQTLQQRPNSHVQIVDADHGHGWQAIWPQMLKRLDHPP